MRALLNRILGSRQSPQAESVNTQEEAAGLQDAAAELQEEKGESHELWVPPGHFYSPLPDLDLVRENEERVFRNVKKTLPGIDLRESEQRALLESLARFYPDLPFPRQKTPEFRYYYDNDFFSYSDAIDLFLLLRHLEPKRIIEVGSGFSSSVMLDTNERFFDGAIDLKFIEPYPERLKSLLRPESDQAVQILESDLQAVQPDIFETLEAGDILFVDSTHVMKTFSDVNYLLFEILPRLAEGVAVHFHDVIYPFEYPKSWVYEGRAWNEAYALRAFLQYNNGFEILLFNSFLWRFHRDFLQTHMPLCLENSGGAIWLRKAVGPG